MKALLSFLLLIFCANSSWAYIPKLKTILRKSVERHGRQNGFIIKREVEIQDLSLKSQETWYIADAGSMKVVASGTTSGESWGFEILYQNGKRKTLTTNGKAKSFKMSPEFFEPLLHYRSVDSFAQKLHQMDILPASYTLFLKRDSTLAEKSLLKLNRHKGHIVYSLGLKDNLDASQIWIEQDSFHLVQLRLASGSTINFNSYQNYDKRPKKFLTFPSMQSIQWSDSTILIRTLSVETTSATSIRRQLKLSKSSPSRLPKQKIFKAFYTRFR